MTLPEAIATICRGMNVIFGIVRFICHLPWGYYGFMGASHYKFLKGHTNLLIEPPLDRNVSIALGLNGPGVRERC